MRIFGKRLGMNVRALMIVIALIVVGAGGVLAYDLLQDGGFASKDNGDSSFTECSMCAAHKADLESVTREIEARSRRVGLSDPNAD